MCHNGTYHCLMNDEEEGRSRAMKRASAAKAATDLSPPLLFFPLFSTGRNPWPVLSAFRAPTSIGVTHSLSGRSINRSHPCLLVLYQHCLKDFQAGFNFEDLVYSQLSLSQDYSQFQSTENKVQHYVPLELDRHRE